MHIDELETPVPVVDLDRMEANITRLQAYLDEHKISESAVTLNVIRAASAINRLNLLSPRMLYGRKMSSKPASAITSASLTFWQVMPTAPASICSFAMAGILCVLI